MPSHQSTPTPWAAAGALLLVALLALASAPAAAQIQRWTDARGQVHFGDMPPPADGKNVKAVPGAAPLTAEDDARARARMQQYERDLKPPAPVARSPKPATPALGPASAPEANSCVAQWNRYTAALACIDPCRNANGGLNGDCAMGCPQVAQPACRMPEEVNRELRKRY